MARTPSDKKAASKAGPRKRKEDTTVPPIPLSFEEAVKALLGTPPPKKTPKR
jgi:hypothetical protein